MVICGSENPTLSAIAFFFDKTPVFPSYIQSGVLHDATMQCPDLQEAGMAGLAIYNRPKTGTSYRPYKRAEERRGVKTGAFEGCSTSGPLTRMGANRGWRPDAQTFEIA